MRLTGIRLENIRIFAEENLIPIGPGLTVLMGRNNSGKSTVLRAPFVALQPPTRPSMGSHFRRSDTAEGAVGLQFHFEPEEFESKLKFGVARGGDVQVVASGPRGPALVPLTTQSAFSDWQAAPHVELGVRWSRHGTLRSLRLVSGHDPARSWVELQLASDVAPRAQIDGEPREARAKYEWFIDALRDGLVEEHAGIPPSVIAHWEHQRPEVVSQWIGNEQSQRRVIDTEEGRLQETLTFLKMKHSSEFDAISRSMKRALPEFERLDFIDTKGSGFDYRPGFLASGAGNRLLSREQIGTGTWSYLCIVTAARAARATGARVIFLDEPQIHMHPGLERLLLEELLEPSLWADGPLQVVAATHSPAFVNAAAENGTLNVVDWADKERRTAKVDTFGNGSGREVLDSLISQPSDLLYADRLVFAEGPSDVAALRIIARQRCDVRRPVRYVPLRETDAVARDLGRYFSIISRSHGVGFLARGVLVLDGDKREACQKAWARLAPTEDPSKLLTVVWSDGGRGNDFESAFCDENFLLAYFADSARAVPEGDSRVAIREALASVGPGNSKGTKGCAAVRRLHEQLLGARDTASSKADDLEALVRFYVKHATETCADGPRAVLKELEEALRAIDEGP